MSVMTGAKRGGARKGLRGAMASSIQFGCDLSYTSNEFRRVGKIARHQLWMASNPVFDRKTIQTVTIWFRAETCRWKEFNGQFVLLDQLDDSVFEASVTEL
jgi:hypothetical protein